VQTVALIMSASSRESAEIPNEHLLASFLRLGLELGAGKAALSSKAAPTPEPDATTASKASRAACERPPRPHTPAAMRASLALLRDFGGLHGLARASPDELTAALRSAHAGMSAAAASRATQYVHNALELGRRAASEAMRPPPAFAEAKDVAQWAASSLATLEHEELWLLALDGRSRLRASRCIARGGLHAMSASPCEALRAALRTAASAFVLVHNHPSGDPTPSREDAIFTHRVAEGAVVIGVPLLDHVIVTREAFASVPMTGPC